MDMEHDVVFLLHVIVTCNVSHDVRAVGRLKNVRNAIGVARAVMDHTSHTCTLLAGDNSSLYSRAYYAFSRLCKSLHNHFEFFLHKLANFYFQIIS